MPDNENITLLIESAAQGDPKAASALLPLVYEELRKLAATCCGITNENRRLLTRVQDLTR